MSTKKFYTEADYKRLNGGAGTREGEDGQSAFRKDYARLLHAPSFRRLQGKTQLFPSVESDYFRNRLTHSLEVAQIAGAIAAALNANAMKQHFGDNQIDCDLVEFAALAHDLGHPPFGHNGEKALDELMKPYGGFEGNAQTLRILAVTEQKLARESNGTWSTKYGLNLTYRALASVLKYDRKIPSRRKQGDRPAKGYYASESQLVQAIKKQVAPGFDEGAFKTIECSIMDVADDIAYSTYDIEDSFHAQFLTPFDLIHALTSNKTVAATVLERTNESLKKNGYKRLGGPEDMIEVLAGVFDKLGGRSEGSSPDISRAIQGAEAWAYNRRFATDALVRTQFTAERVGTLIQAVELVPSRSFPQLSRVRLKREELVKVEILKHLSFELVIRSPRLAVVEYRGKDLVKELFEALFESGGTLLPEDWKSGFLLARGQTSKARVICDYIASMTDRYAAELHSRLFDKGTTIFKPL